MAGIGPTCVSAARILAAGIFVAGVFVAGVFDEPSIARQRGLVTTSVLFRNTRLCMRCDWGGPAGLDRDQDEADESDSHAFIGAKCRAVTEAALPAFTRGIA